MEILNKKKTGQPGINSPIFPFSPFPFFLSHTFLLSTEVFPATEFLSVSSVPPW